MTVPYVETHPNDSGAPHRPVTVDSEIPPQPVDVLPVVNRCMCGPTHTPGSEEVYWEQILMGPEVLLGATRPKSIDRCIAVEIVVLNQVYGVQTLGSCCGHNKGEPLIQVPRQAGNWLFDHLSYELSDWQPEDPDSMSLRAQSLRPRLLHQLKPRTS